MRTTIEIDDAKLVKLKTMAAERGERGFSVLIDEALERYELLLGDIEVRSGGLGDRIVALEFGELDQLRGIADAPFEGAPRLHPLAGGGQFLHEGSCGFGVVPEGGGAGLLFELGYAGFVVSEVKVAPGGQRCAGRVRGHAKGVRS